MGSVFKAHHLGLHKDVAVKLLHPELTADDEMVARFDREAAAASRLDHPNCVRTMDFGSTDEGRRYLVMEKLEGKDLAELVTEPMPPFRVVDLVGQVLAGLAHAHTHGLVHRDIKTENIFVLDTEAGEQVKLLDFGIAKVSHGAGAKQLTQTGMVFGTPHYMSPEQARGEKTDARSDLYSLGIVMYAMLAGELPFHGEDAMALLRQQIAEEPPALPDSIPGSLRGFVKQLLAKDPAERFTDATTAAAALRRAASPTQPPAVPEVHPTLAATAAAGAEADPEDDRETLADNRSAHQPLPPPPSPPPSAPPASSTATAERPRWLLPVIGVGAVGLLGLLIAVWPEGEDSDTAPETAVAAGAPTDEVSAPGADGSDDVVVVNDDSDATPKGDQEDGADDESQSERALRATFKSVDQLIESKKYDSARITIEPSLEVYRDEPGLHWRMGRVLVALGRKANATAALESYRSALALKPDLLDDEAFAEAFWDLLDDPVHRELSSRIAIDLLGERGHDRLAEWVNVQNAPLSYASRHAATEHLRAAGQGDRVNEPLQTALDLWQASVAEVPCDAFDRALRAAKESPDSYLLGTLSRVSVPKTGEGEEAVECPGLAAALGRARDEYTQRYAGLDPTIPAAYQRRKPSGQPNKRRRRR